MGMVTDSVSNALLNSSREVTSRALTTVEHTYSTKVHFVITANQGFPNTVRRLGKARLAYSCIIDDNTRMQGPRRRIMGDAPVSVRLYRRICGATGGCPMSMTFFASHCSCHVKAGGRVRSKVVRRVHLFGVSVSADRRVMQGSPRCHEVTKGAGKVSSVHSLRDDNTPMCGVFVFTTSIRRLRGLDSRLGRGPTITITSSFVCGRRVATMRTRGNPILGRCVRSLNCAVSRIVILNSDLGSCSVVSVSFNTAITVRGTIPRVGGTTGCVAGDGGRFNITCTVSRILRHRKG